MKLGLIHHTLFEFEESRRAYQEGFALWQQVSETPLAALPTAPHAFRLATIGITTLDPSYPVTYDDTAVTTQLFRGLVERTPEMDVIPEAARVWEVLEGGV